MLFKKSRIPRGYMLLEDIKDTRAKPGRSWLFWLVTSCVLFATALLFAELATAENINSLCNTEIHL